MEEQDDRAEKWFAAGYIFMEETMWLPAGLDEI